MHVVVTELKPQSYTVTRIGPHGLITFFNSLIYIHLILFIYYYLVNIQLILVYFYSLFSFI